MEGNKLDLIGKKEEKQPLASYKALPEADMEDEIHSPKTIVKILNATTEDGADEKMLSDDESKLNKIDISDQKIILKEKNGEAKLDICELKSAFAGMGKDELMKYANDPFWIRIRKIFFILFWLLWLGMLVGAISIIYSAPKCNPPPPKTWWEEGPLAEIKSDITIEQIKELKSSGIKGLIYEWTEDTYAELNDENINLINKINDIDIPIILDIEASMSNLWFDKSEKGIDYNDYYIWKSSKLGDKEPPNNWISRKNESSWKYSTIRKEYYYAPEGWPQLNFRNENVTEEFIKVLRKFTNKGIKGFRIRDAHILLVDNNFENQLPSQAPEYFLNSYGYYVHSKTENLIDLAPLLYKWRNVAKNLTNNGPFMVKNSFSKLEAYTFNGNLVVDLPTPDDIVGNQFESVKIVHALEYVYKTQRFNWPLWTHKSTLPQDVLDTLTYLLPGVPLIQSGTKVNEELLKIRDTPPIMRGEIEYKAISNKTILAVTRLAGGSPGILIVINPLNETVIVDLPKEMDKVSNGVTVHFKSKNYNETNIEIGIKKEANNLPISGKSSIVFTYTVKKDNE